MSSQLLSERSRVFQRADPYAVSDYVNQHVGGHSLRLPRSGDLQASINHRKFASLDLCRLSYGGRARITSPALGSLYHLQILLKGHCHSSCRGDEHHYVPGELLLINPDDPVDLTYSADCEKFILKLPASQLEQACLEQRWQLPEGGIRFASARHATGALEGFIGLLRLVCEEAENTQSLPQVQKHYEQIVASKLLSLLGNNIDRCEPGLQAHSFEQLAAYIDANLHQDIGVSQLMTVARVSERSLYSLFERHAGLSPKGYVRQRKLARIHAALQDPSSPVRNVTEIALDYGFLHLGRFAESYRQRFGELPSVTFKRHR
ncbi:AraC family transcriptional regulator [Pseudomonas rubra]|uniref:AraC family transcriptional regulator n=1 Tax=Pseudomonas rubra TaxID=2942627 RepID=A0ABT5PD30_9PSED|nr:AraC family transcriptional regulator [Pseudomonas rubra]MDD1016214.1 AraC family transcriptional regulator [Pseudomonas rubra]MDD1039863.1 AraC family transcriptional regulator [Pseudomonas rubra]MDD1156162.1 AraC family transcriptional regulator [Pseudomonas rubra]